MPYRTPTPPPCPRRPPRAWAGRVLEWSVGYGCFMALAVGLSAIGDWIALLGAWHAVTYMRPESAALRAVFGP